MNRRLTRLTLCALLLAGILRFGAASAHSERVTGVVLTVLAERRQAIVRRDASGSKPALTTLFRLSPKIDAASLHAGDRIVAGVEQGSDGLLLGDLRIVPATPPRSVFGTVHPLQIGDRMPATRFIDQFGRRFDFAEFRGKSVVLAFIYTRCRDPKECPLISS